MRLPFAVKKTLQRTARRLGYRLEAIRGTPAAIDVFDLVVKEQMRRHAAPAEFTFVQIGANDGISDDPIREYVLKYGWRGVLVEPQPAVFARLVKNYDGRAHLRFANAAVSRAAGKITMYTAGEPGSRDLLASFDPAVVRKQLRAGEEMGTIEVDAVPLGELLRRHEIASLDLLQIDAEGYDAEIIRMIDFAALRPAIIRFEHINLSPRDYAACAELLAAKGYRMSHQAIDTIAYVQDIC